MHSQSPSEPSGADRGAPSDLSVTTRRAVSLRGQTASPGIVLAPLHLKDFDLDALGGRRIQRDRVERELERFRAALSGAEQQLAALRQSVAGRLSEADLRILDTHLALLQDGVFIADVERLILEKHYALEAAIAKVVGDFDRIFKLVQSERLRQNAVDLRDVGIRVLRNLAPEPVEQRSAALAQGRYVLVARELSIVDMFSLDNQHVAGIATEEGSLAAHAAIFARSLGIPTLVGVKGLLEKASEGLPALLDASEGFICFDPDERLKAQFQRQPRPAGPTGVGGGQRSTRDGVEVELSAVCGSLPEVELAARAQAARISVYRTELLFLIDAERPSREALVLHYRAVLEAAAGAPVTFRLLSHEADRSGSRPGSSAPRPIPSSACAACGTCLRCRPCWSCSSRPCSWPPPVSGRAWRSPSWSIWGISGPCAMPWSPRVRPSRRRAWLRWTTSPWAWCSRPPPACGDSRTCAERPISASWPWVP